VSARCCQAALGPQPRRSRWIQRSASAAGWIVPGVILAAVPKCPVCVAAYIALLTGCGISLAAAGTLRLLLILTCVSALTYLALRTTYRLLRRGKPPESPLAV
jgi:hypothetical protein